MSSITSTKKPSESSHLSLPPSGNVITLCIGYCIYFLIFHFPQSVHLSFLLSLLPCMHSIFILTLNGISSPEIRYQPGCPLLFQPRSEDSCYRAETALSPVDLMLSLCPIPLQHWLFIAFICFLTSLFLTFTPLKPLLLPYINYHLH